MKTLALLAISVALASTHAYAQNSDSGSAPGAESSGGYGYQDHPSHTPTFGSQAAQGDESPFASNAPAAQAVSATQPPDASQPDPRSDTPEKAAPGEGK